MAQEDWVRLHGFPVCLLQTRHSQPCLWRRRQHIAHDTVTARWRSSDWRRRYSAAGMPRRGVPLLSARGLRYTKSMC